MPATPPQVVLATWTLSPPWRRTTRSWRWIWRGRDQDCGLVGLARRRRHCARDRPPHWRRWRAPRVLSALLPRPVGEANICAQRHVPLLWFENRTQEGFIVTGSDCSLYKRVKNK